MTTFDPGPLADVRLRSDPAGESTLVLRRDLAHSPSRAWVAVTDPEKLGEWAPYTADRDLGAPGPATLRMLDGDSPEDLPTTVREVRTPWLLAYDWGGERLRWELEAADGGSRLTLLHTLAEPGTASRMAAGWHLCLLVAERRLDGQSISPIRGMAAMDFGWAELERAYAAKLGSAS